MNSTPVVYLYVLSGILLLLLFGLYFLLSAKRKKEKILKAKEELQTHEILKDSSPEALGELLEEQELAEKAPVEVSLGPVKAGPTWFQRLTKGMSKTRHDIWSKVEEILLSQQKGLTSEQIDQVEELLFKTDMGPVLVEEIIQEIRRQGDQFHSLQDIKKTLHDFLSAKMIPVQSKNQSSLFAENIPAVLQAKPHQTKIIMIVGVNGAGKTTTIGKLATQLIQNGAKVLVGACDTFRAAAVEQLEVWCQRAGAEMMKAKEGADPSGVAFEACQRAVEIGADFCLLDTAGRLHTKVNLMEELKKTKRVMSKVLPEAPHEVLLVIDAITGQNAVKQAKEFHAHLGLTGLIFTKCDGSSKAGNAVGIVESMQVPVCFIGVGEDVEDLNRFLMEDYLQVLLDYSP